MQHTYFLVAHLEIDETINPPEHMFVDTQLQFINLLEIPDIFPQNVALLHHDKYSKDLFINLVKEVCRSANL